MWAWFCYVPISGDFLPYLINWEVVTNMICIKNIMWSVQNIHTNKCLITVTVATWWCAEIIMQTFHLSTFHRVWKWCLHLCYVACCVPQFVGIYPSHTCNVSWSEHDVCGSCHTFVLFNCMQSAVFILGQTTADL